MNFEAFIKASETREMEKKVKFERVGDHITLRALTEEETTELRKKHTRNKKNSKGVDVPELDTAGYSRDIVTRAVVYPDLTNAEFQNKLGTQGSPADTLSRFLTAGEYQALQSEIMDFSGFNEELIELKDEVKNELTQVN